MPNKLVHIHLYDSTGSLYLNVDEAYNPISKQLNIAKNKQPNILIFVMVYLFDSWINITAPTITQKNPITDTIHLVTSGHFDISKVVA